MKARVVNDCPWRETRTDGATLGGLWLDRPDSEDVLLFFHGNGEVAADWATTLMLLLWTVRHWSLSTAVRYAMSLDATTKAATQRIAAVIPRHQQNLSHQANNKQKCWTRL